MGQWRLQQANFWETAPFFRLLIPFVIGILYYDTNGSDSISFTGIFWGICTLFILYVFIALRRKFSSAFSIASFLITNILLFCCGIAIACLHDIHTDKQWLGNHIEKYGKYLARVTKDPFEKEHSWKLEVNVFSTINEHGMPPLIGTAYVYVMKRDAPMLLRQGDTIVLPSKWEPIKNLCNPFEYDHALSCSRNNIVYSQLCPASSIRLLAKNDPKATPWVEKAHYWCMMQIDRYITDKETKGLLQAMLLGDEVNLDEDLVRSYSDTGIVHVIAISGGNVTIFFLIISWLLWWLKHKRHLWIKYAVALPLVWFYVVVAGAAPSAIRAALMFSFVAFALMLRKENNNLNSLFATAFLLLVAEPSWLYAMGFQLSFMAVLSLILFYKPLYSLWNPKNKWVAKLWGTIVASMAAELLVAPLVVWYFHTFPVTFIVANVIAYLFMGFVLIAGMAIITVSFMPPIAKFIGAGTSVVVHFFDNIISWLQNFSPRSFHFLQLSGIELLVLYIIIVSSALFFINKQKSKLYTALIASCIILTSFCYNEWIHLHQQYYVVYNISKANYIEHIQGKNYTVLNEDRLSNSHTDNVATPAHIHWQALEKKIDSSKEITRIGNTTVLILDNTMNCKDTFHVDYLIINNNGKVNPAQLQKTFTPKAIIVSNNLTLNKQHKWKTACDDAHIPVHVVADNGAFVIDGNQDVNFAKFVNK